MGHPGGGGVASSLREGGSLFPEEGPRLSLLVSSSSPSLENGVQDWGLVSPALSHCPVSRGASLGASVRPALPDCWAGGKGCWVRAECVVFQQTLKAPALRLSSAPCGIRVALGWQAGPGGPPDLPLSHSSDGDTDSVSTMVVHDVEEIAGTQTPYGGGTMVVQRVSGPPAPFFPSLPCTSLAPALAPFSLFL